ALVGLRGEELDREAGICRGEDLVDPHRTRNGTGAPPLRGCDAWPAVSFHVEISRGLWHARVFNYDRERLHSEVLEPWTQGKRVELGDKQWIPSESALKILEGPELAQADLNFGR